MKKNFDSGEEEKGNNKVDKENGERDKNKIVKPCLDLNDHCKMWADIGHCKWSEKYMAHYCKQSCDLCVKGKLALLVRTIRINGLD